MGAAAGGFVCHKSRGTGATCVWWAKVLSRMQYEMDLIAAGYLPRMGE